LRKKILAREATSELAPFAQESTGPILANVIDSPPIDGFVPWIAVAVTDARLGILEINAIPTTSVVGTYLTYNPQSDYAIGIWDTGAGAHVMGNAAAIRAGMLGPYVYLVTSNTVTLSGATGTVEAWVSEPLGLFVDGLGAIEPNGLLFDTSGMVGQTNVSIVVGQGKGGVPDLPTAIGSPLAAYFAVAFRNDHWITRVRDSNEFTGPDIRFYDPCDPCVPSYSNTIYLELRPTGGAAVQYFPNFVDPFEPVIPSTITVLLPAQSLFFTSRTDLRHNGKTSEQKKFMVDTGAQISVVSESQASELGLFQAGPDFKVEIIGVTGGTVIKDGYYIDSLKINASPQELEFTNVPVVVIDIASPEGGTLEGIIGMNLFVDFNFVFRGGGLPDYGGHIIEFEFIPGLIIGDIAPQARDGAVDYLDLAAFVEAWLAVPLSPNWNSRADLVSDAKINFLDFAVLAEHWLEGTTP
jgi:predicted aspartyl protease